MTRPRLPLFIVILISLVLAACSGAIAATPTVTPILDLPLPPSDTPAPAATDEQQPADKSTPAALAPGPLTIAALGDSLTEGQGDDSGQGGYPSRLQTLVEARRPGTRVLNFGHSGWAAPDLINGLNGEPSELEQALAAKADIAIVWIGSNDLWYLYEYGPDPATDEADQRDLQAYETNIDTILNRLTQSNVKVFIALLDDQSKRAVVAAPPNPAEPALPDTTADDLAHMSAHVSSYNEIIRRKAAEYGAVTVDFYHTDIFTNPATVYDDGNHPNTAGYEKITGIWFAALEPFLR